MGHDYSGIAGRIQPVHKIIKPMRVALYGRAGSGKTTLACSFPAPLLLDIKDDGTDSVTDVKGLQVLRVEAWEDVEHAYHFLENGDHQFKTVILDTVTQLQDVAIQEVLRAKKKKSDDPGGWGSMTKQDWGEVASLLKTWITNFRNLDLNVVFLAQERIFNVDDDSAGEDNQIAPEVGPRMMPSVGSTLNAAVDLIGNAFVRENIRKRKEGGKIFEERQVQYCLRIGPHAYYTTKVRKPRDVEIPAFLVDPSYADLLEIKTGSKE